MLDKITPEENVLRLEIEALEKKIALMKQLSSTSGFYEFYFKNIKNHKSRKECFEVINELHHSLFGRYRYSDYGVFKNTISRIFKQKKS